MFWCGVPGWFTRVGQPGLASDGSWLLFLDIPLWSCHRLLPTAGLKSATDRVDDEFDLQFRTGHGQSASFAAQIYLEVAGWTARAKLKSGQRVQGAAAPWVCCFFFRSFTA